MSERIYLASPHMSEQGYEQQYVKEAFETNWVAPLGPNVTNFEKELAQYVGVKVSFCFIKWNGSDSFRIKSIRCDVRRCCLLFNIDVLGIM